MQKILQTRTTITILWEDGTTSGQTRITEIRDEGDPILAVQEDSAYLARIICGKKEGGR